MTETIRQQQKTITITVRSQADVHNPTGAGLTVNQNHTITDAELKAKVSNYAPGTLSYKVDHQQLQQEMQEMR